MNLHELKAHLSAYARRVKKGETIMVCERNKPIAELRPLAVRSKRERAAPGLFAGKIKVNDDFFREDAAISGMFNDGPA